MYAIIETGGRQYRVATGDTLKVERIEGKEGDLIEMPKVIAVGEGENISVGKPTLESAKVLAEILSHGKADKVVVFKMKRRKNYRRLRGHRQHFTQLRIREISGGEDNGS